MPNDGYYTGCDGQTRLKGMKYYNSVLLAACSSASMTGTTLHSRASRAPRPPCLHPLPAQYGFFDAEWEAFQRMELGSISPHLQAFAWEDPEPKAPSTAPA